MRYLLDTCVVSELQNPEPHPRVVGMVTRLALHQTFMSVVTIGELQKGISLLPESRRRTRLEEWLIGLEEQFVDNTLPVDSETAHIWGEITANAQRSGRRVLAGDGLIAATARRHGLTVMTRNVGDFEPTGVLIVNPWDATWQE